MGWVDANGGLVKTSTFHLKAGTYRIAFRLSSDYYGVYGVWNYSFSLLYTQAVKTNDIEPNDEPAQGWALTPGSSGDGHLGYIDYSGATEVNDTRDWWTIDLLEDGTLQIDLGAISINERGNGIGGALYGADGDTQLIGSLSGLGSIEANLGMVAATTFHLKAGRYNLAIQLSSDYYGVYGIWNYTVSPSFTRATIDNDLEPNDTPSLAKYLVLDAASEGHLGYIDYSGQTEVNDTRDWLTVMIPEDGYLHLDLTAISVNTRGDKIGGTLYGANGESLSIDSLERLGVLEADGAQVARSTFPLKAGTYGVSVDVSSDYYGVRGIWNYTLLPSFEAFPVSNDLEPNDTIALAQSMSLYGAAEGHLGLLDYSGVESANDIDDWWRLTVSTRGELTLELSATSIDERGGPIAAALYDSNGNAVGSIGGIGALSANNGNVESHTFSVEPGVYQLEVDHGSDYYGTRGIWVYTVTPTYVPEVTAVEDFFLY